jgi:hypothetical protein
MQGRYRSGCRKGYYLKTDSFKLERLPVRSGSHRAEDPLLFSTLESSKMEARGMVLQGRVGREERERSRLRKRVANGHSRHAF